MYIPPTKEGRASQQKKELFNGQVYRPNISRQVIASLGECNGEGSIHLLYLPPPTQILGIRKGECVIDSLSYPSHLQ